MKPIMNKGILLAVVALTCVVTMTRPATAYDEWLWALNWNVVIPESDTADFIKDTSYRGMSLEGRKWQGDNLTVGFMLGWNVLDQKLFTTENVEGPNASVDITGTQYRYINSFPVLAGVHMYLGRWGLTRLFAGAMGGGYVVERRTELGLFAVESQKWQWGVAPEVGVLLPLETSVFFISARYNHAFENGDDHPAHTYWSAQIGLGWN
jgi:hypothetical protein